METFLIQYFVTFAADRGLVVARVPVPRAPAPAPAAAAALARALRQDRCLGQDLVHHPKILKNLLKQPTLVLCIPTLNKIRYAYYNLLLHRIQQALQSSVIKYTPPVHQL